MKQPRHRHSARCSHDQSGSTGGGGGVASGVKPSDSERPIQRMNVQERCRHGFYETLEILLFVFILQAVAQTINWWLTWDATRLPNSPPSPLLWFLVLVLWFLVFIVWFLVFGPFGPTRPTKYYFL